MIWLMDIGEEEEVIFPDQQEVEEPIPVVIPQSVPVEMPDIRQVLEVLVRFLAGATLQPALIRNA